MTSEKKARIVRDLHFWLSGKITDREKVLAQIALDCNATPEEVWQVYTEMLDAVFSA